jgi:hypothetical protein
VGSPARQNIQCHENESVLFLCSVLVKWAHAATHSPSFNSRRANKQFEQQQTAVQHISESSIEILKRES